MEQNRCQRHESRIADSSINGGALHEGMEGRWGAATCSAPPRQAGRPGLLPGLFSLLGFLRNL